MAAVRMFIDKFGKEVLIEETHPLAIAQRAKGTSTKQPPAPVQEHPQEPTEEGLAGSAPAAPSGGGKRRGKK